MTLDPVDRHLINALQDGFPIVERPFAAVAAQLDLDEDEVVARIRRLLDAGVLSRFGPLYDAERMGGGLTLAALAVPPERFDEVAGIVNAFPEVAHNYARDHALNMWFVIATERPQQVRSVIEAIEAASGLPVLDLPKIEEYFLGLRLDA
ncbi:MAG: Lrp/AsnC family transcriptional regulator [Alphaproteobacteria bacterium]|nr:MAG: Lrp/AsnC family transcriptional regulator [Alphaproteobacteria bacterium]